MSLYQLKPDYRASTTKHLFLLNHLARHLEYIFNSSENIIYPLMTSVAYFMYKKSKI